MGYYDIHSHLVPGVDDGSQDEEMSRALLRQAQSEGISTMIITPHNYPGRSEGKIAKVKERFALLQEIAAEETPEIELHLGNEVFYRESFVADLREGKALPLAGTHYVLTEFHPGAPKRQVTEALRQILMGGYIPIVAHIERIESFYGEEEDLITLRDMGAYLQVNTHTFLGGLFDRRSAFWRRMAAEEIISFLGSDAHHPDKRPVMMEAAVQKLAKKMDEDALWRLTEENARKVIAGEMV